MAAGQCTANDRKLPQITATSAQNLLGQVLVDLKA